MAVKGMYSYLTRGGRRRKEEGGRRREEGKE